MKIAFITGITGQDGSYLSELLLKKGYKVYGIIRRTSMFNTTRIDHIRHNIHLRYGDLSDISGLSNWLNDIVRNNKNFKVFEIYNLAAQSHVKISFEIPEYTSVIDGLGVLNLLEIIKTFPDEIKNKTRFYQAGTSEMFGKVLQTPQNEQTPFNPMSPYAAAKVYAHNIVKCYRDGYGLYAVNGILFNHESPRRGENFVTMKIIRGIQNILNNKQECIELGNLNSMRDWGHAKDYVYGMWLMMQQDNSSDYVLATGKTYSIKQFIEKAFEQKNMKLTWEGHDINLVGRDTNGIIRIKINPKFFRPCEVDLLLGDPTYSKQILNWELKYDTLDKIIYSMFEDE
tara:strand:+ start:5798 stop:6823 length:1026 start_codon:yes stop_codon:yes gene_type:complete